MVVRTRAARSGSKSFPFASLIVTRRAPLFNRPSSCTNKSDQKRSSTCNFVHEHSVRGSSDESMSNEQCTLCAKELDKRISAHACLTCDMSHVAWVHQRCFDKALDKAIRLRSTRSTSFEVCRTQNALFARKGSAPFNANPFSTRPQNIARSATHNWKTQKCALPDCIKWLAEYEQVKSCACECVVGLKNMNPEHLTHAATHAFAG